jgi:outer membrane protein assembly factor BamB
MKRVCALACGVWLAAAARAEPVPIGRYTEIRVGVSHENPYATSAADARRSGRSRARASKATPNMLWSVLLPHRRLVPPTVLADGTLIVGSAGGVYAVDPASGEARWFAPIGEVSFSPSVTPAGELVAIAAGRFVVISKDGSTRTLELRAFQTAASLVLDSGTMLGAGREGELVALTPDGGLLASVRLSLPGAVVRFDAWAGADLVVAAGRTSELLFLSLQSGATRALRLSEPVAGSPLVADDEMIWVLGQRGTLFGVTAAGEVRISFAIGQGSPTDGLALGWDGGLRVGLRYGEIACFGPSGRERWRRGLDSAPGPLLVDADNTVLFVSTRGTLYAIDRDGELRWRQGLGVHGAGRPVLAANGTIYVVSRGGELQAWR